MIYGIYPQITCTNYILRTPLIYYVCLLERLIYFGPIPYILKGIWECSLLIFDSNILPFI